MTWLQRIIIGRRRLQPYVDAYALLDAAVEGLRLRRLSGEQLRAEEALLTSELVAGAKALASLYPGPTEEHD